MDPVALLSGLDESQLRAVTAPEHPLCILAGAGSGKTRVLTRRIAHRALAEQIDPRHVLALTFTRKAAGELGGRLGRLGLRDLPTTGTFHAVAWAQLHTWWKGRDQATPELLDRKGRLLGRLLGRTTRMNVGELATEIEWAKARLVDPDRYPTAAARADRRTGLPADRVAGLYAAYEHEKRTRRVLDFDDLLERCADALDADPIFAEAQRWRFRHLFVDEFQDVNPLQHRLLSAWLGGRFDLCVVGDPNQAIYRWNGADASFLVDFAVHYPGARVVELMGNHRSSPQILAVAAAVLDGGTNPSGSRLRASRPDGPVPAIVAYPTDDDEARGIARAVRDNHGAGGGWSRQAVLMRTNGQTALVEQALRSARIPFRVKGATPFLARPEVQRALATLDRAPRLRAALADLDPVAGDDAELPDREREERASLATLVRLGHEFLGLEPDGTARELRWWLTATVRSDDPGPGADAVDVVTFHAAKGLEWPVVHLAGLEDGLVPISHARTPEAAAEEQRLLYVAVTRAGEVLRGTWAERRTFGSHTVGRRPSPYLGPLGRAADALRADAAAVDHDRGLARARAQLDVVHRPDDHAELVHALREWRAGVARAAGTSPDVVLSDVILTEVAEQRPETTAELADVRGLGPVKAGEYGDTLLALVAGHRPD